MPSHRRDYIPWNGVGRTDAGARAGPLLLLGVFLKTIQKWSFLEMPTDISFESLGSLLSRSYHLANDDHFR